MSVEHVPLLLALTAALCFAFGLYTFFAPETRESSYIRMNARVISLRSEGADGRTPTLEWETDGKTVRRPRDLCAQLLIGTVFVSSSVR